jgi:hypothetical protein
MATEQHTMPRAVVGGEEMGFFIFNNNAGIRAFFWNNSLRMQLYDINRQNATFLN